jgi:hypothetical protein
VLEPPSPMRLARMRLPSPPTRESVQSRCSS